MPLQSISLGYKQEKTRLLLKLRESTIQSVRNANAKVRTGRKWNAEAEANQKERKEMVVAEVTRMEEERYKIKAVSQGRQGSWTTWDEVVNRKTSCKTALSQGRYRWRHDQVLRKLAEVLEGRRQESRGCPPPLEHHIHFVREGGGRRSTKPRETPRLFSNDQEWNMRVDLGRQLQFPGEITTMSLRPDIVVWSTKAKTVLLIELTVPWEKGIEAAFERKKTKYSELAAECREAGWKTTIYPVEIGCRGFVGQPHAC
ncbi:hypothetical protein SKAU_G00315530 [Synaphobranchus kaupii]|uniref:Reverse transcriptase n=1 Tax=Synaphobranchus kaupii TaxID=118154 RepID=A0A9Q1ESL2_SYNKA|nr:hypothetical protein SKAU_G00315530 [Synaphobranchus kaupii]